mmetsp:Transcript_13374/g.15002  ORF Transcript_13374/g.15002 Transcript_13374/m.15002 type:complete len:145 (+) Transcript_13374:300-734(+)
MKKLFGTKRGNKKLVLPIESKEYHNLSHQGQKKTMNRYKISIKTYDEENSMPWMGSSIKLDQPSIKKIDFNNFRSGSKPKNKIFLNQTSKLHSLVPNDYGNVTNINNYQYLSGISDRNRSVENILSRRSKVLQASARDNFEKSS